MPENLSLIESNTILLYCNTHTSYILYRKVGVGVKSWFGSNLLIKGDLLGLVIEDDRLTLDRINAVADHR